MVSLTLADDNDRRMLLGRNLTYGLLGEIGRAIVTGQFEEPGFPTEAELSFKYGVSRSVTREAVKMLTAKGLLSARPRAGTMINRPDEWNLFDPDVLDWLMDRAPSIDLLRQFNQLRLAIEPEAAALAATFGDEGDIERIRVGLNRMKSAEQGRDDPLASDIAFHVAILRASKNPFFLQFRNIVATALKTSIRFTNRLAGHNASIAEHAAVYAAVANRDRTLAAKTMRTIIADVLTLIDLNADAFHGSHQ